MAQIARMWYRFIFAVILMAAGGAQGQSLQHEMANLREDVRGLVQRVGELTLRIEQLERENGTLRGRLETATDSYVTMKMLNDSVTDLQRAIRTASATTKSETLQQVAVQMERLAKQTNDGLESLAKGMATRQPVHTVFTEDFPKEGVSYTVQRGDTLSSIAQRHNARVADIVNANKISDPTRIQVGQTLFIPARN